jgi:hypothetical protein
MPVFDFLEVAGCQIIRSPNVREVDSAPERVGINTPPSGHWIPGAPSSGSHARMCASQAAAVVFMPNGPSFGTHRDAAPSSALTDVLKPLSHWCLIGIVANGVCGVHDNGETRGRSEESLAPELA